MPKREREEREESNMAGKKKENLETISGTIETTFVPTKALKDQYSRAFKEIKTIDAKAEGYAQRKALLLYTVRSKKLYMLEEAGGYAEDGFTQWCEERIDLSRGAANEAVNTFARFKDADGKAIDQKWSGYSFTVLTKLKGFTDEQIAEMKVDETMSKMQIINAIDAYKTLKLLDKKKAEKQDIFNNSMQVLRDLNPANLLESKKGALPLVTKILNSEITDYSKKLARDGLTADDLAQATKVINNLVDLCENDMEPKLVEDYKHNLKKLEGGAEQEESQEDNDETEGQESQPEKQGQEAQPETQGQEEYVISISELIKEANESGSENANEYVGQAILTAMKACERITVIR